MIYLQADAMYFCGLIKAILEWGVNVSLTLFCKIKFDW